MELHAEFMPGVIAWRSPSSSASSSSSSSSPSLGSSASSPSPSGSMFPSGRRRMGGKEGQRRRRTDGQRTRRTDGTWFVCTYYQSSIYSCIYLRCLSVTVLYEVSTKATTPALQIYKYIVANILGQKAPVAE